MTRTRTRTSSRKIEYWLLGSLLSGDANPETRDEGAVKGSFVRFGVVAAIVVVGWMGRIVSGRGRRKALL